MRVKKKRGKKLLWILAGIALFLLAIVALVANLDIACELVAREAQNAAKTYLDADLKIGQVKGNPLAGYRIIGVILSKDGADMFKAEFMEAKINFMSLLSSPRLSFLSIGGVNMDLDKFVEEINKLPSQPSDQPFQAPIDELKLVQSSFFSKWGKVEVEDVGLGFNQYTITANVNGKVNALPVTGTLAAEIKGTLVSLKNANLKVGKGSVKASGQLSDTLDAQGAIEAIDVTELISLFPDLAPEDFAGTVDMSFNASGTWTNPVFSALANFKGTRLAGWPVDSFNSTVNYKEMRLSLDKLTANAFGIPLSGNMAMAFRDASPSVFVELSGGPVDLSTLGSFGNVKGVTGSISDFKAEIKGPTNALSGTISLHAPKIGALGVNGTDIALQIKLSGSNQATVNGKMKLQGADSYMSGTVSDLLSGPKLNLTFKTVELNTAALKPLIPDTVDTKGTVTAEVNVKGSTSNPSLDGTLSSKSLSVAGYAMDNLSVGFSYAQENFTLKDSSASWSGLPVKASGTVKNVLAEKPTLDINASLSLNPGALAKFIPDVAQYKLKGTVQAGIHVTGALPEPKLDLVVSSQELAALDMFNAKNIKATTALTGDLAKLDKMDLDVAAQSISVSGLGFQNVSARINKSGDAVNLVSAKALSGQGSLSGSGKVTVPKSGTGDININVDMTQLDLRELSKTGNLGIDLAGTFSGKLALTGKTSAPSITFQGDAPLLSVAGYGINNLAMKLSGNAMDLKLDSLSAQIGTGNLSASGNFKPSDGTGQIDFTGSGLDLAKLTENAPELKGQISGTLSAQFKADISGKGASGSGSASVPSLNIYGMKLSDVSIPLKLDGANFIIGQGTAKLNGGDLSLNGSVNTQKQNYSGSLKASNVDVNALIHDLVPGLGGKIAGKGALDVAFNGTIGPKFTLGGTGQANVGSGGISGFKWIDLVTRLYGVDSVRYTDVTAPFKLETTRLILQKGSKATAPDNDPLYKYVQVEGPITYAGDLNLTGEGNMNFQLINVAAGGILGAAGAAAGNVNDLLSGKGLEGLLSQAVGRGAEAGKQADFRDVSFKIGGNYENPSFSIVKVGPSSLPAESSDPQKQQQQQQQQPKDVVKDMILDRIGIPTNNDAPESEPNQQQQQSEPPKEEQPKKKAEDVVKDAVKEEAGKALQDLLRRRR